MEKKFTIKYFVKRIIEGSIIEGSLFAVILSFRDMLLNVKSSTLHLLTYYFNKKIHKYNKLHFGCGKNYKQGFCNIDVRGSVADAYLDARNRMPFKDNSIDYIYSSHLVEHLENHELMLHTIECYRMLSAKGVLRLAIPNFEDSIKSYLNKDVEKLKRVKEIRPLFSQQIGIPEDYICYMDYFNAGIHEFGHHKICLDYEKIKNILIYCGFDPLKIKEVEFDRLIDPQKRGNFSFFVEAVK